MKYFEKRYYRIIQSIAKKIIKIKNSSQDKEFKKAIRSAVYLEKSNKDEVRLSINKNRKLLVFNSDWNSKYKLDSLLYHIMHSGWRHVPQEGVLNEIINSGKLSFIDDNRLKSQISSLPRAYSQMIENDRIGRLHITVNIVPFFYEKSSIRNTYDFVETFEFSETPLGMSKFNFSDKNLLRNPSFENILSFQSTYQKFGIEFLEKVRLKYFEIQELIEKKYPEVDYNELDKDLDRGVWN